MRLVLISDTHQCHLNRLPEGDVLVHAGDLTNNDGSFYELGNFNNWLGTLSFKHKLIIGGNHDRTLNTPGLGKMLITNGTFLENELVEINGIKFYGSPTNKIGGEWYGNMNREQDATRIPEGIDVLFTHGPAYGVMDVIDGDSSHGFAGSHSGCEYLLEAIKRVKPRYAVWGHIHERFGQDKIGDTICYNVALAGTTLWGGQYREPVVIDI